MATLTMSSIDVEAKPTSTRLNVIDAVTDPQAQSVIDAMDDVIIGAAIRGTVTVPNVVDVGSQVPPTDLNARVGNKLLMRLQDGTTGGIYTNEMGTFDNLDLPAGNDFLDLTAGVGLALKTAIDAVWESPLGNTGVLVSAQQVNRKSS
jgi:hypothetical protein